jgi:hypothetical protein
VGIVVIVVTVVIAMNVASVASIIVVMPERVLPATNMTTDVMVATEMVGAMIIDPNAGRKAEAKAKVPSEASQTKVTLLDSSLAIRASTLLRRAPWFLPALRRQLHLRLPHQFLELELLPVVYG